MTRLAGVAPTYAVRGNWDTRQWGRIDLFGGTGAVEVENRAVRVALDGGRALWLVGLDADSGDQIESVLGRVPAGALTVLLHHYPEEMDRVAARGVDSLLRRSHPRRPGGSPVLRSARHDVAHRQALRGGALP